jgi:type VI secretion system protein ImpH
MASEARPSNDSLAALQALQERPYAFNFFEAMRRIECAWAAWPRLGTAARPTDEPVRLGQKPSLDFPASMLASAESIEGNRLRIQGYFLGLYGPNGPLPLHLTEYVHDRLTNGRDPTLAAFTDMFHHRMLELFYRAWADVRPTVHYDRPESDVFATYLAALIGINQPALRNRDEWPDRAKLFFAGLLSGPRSRAGLEALLGEYLQLPVNVEECVGEWLSLEPEEHMRLGEPTAAFGTAVLGEQAFSAQHKLRIVVGPLDVPQLLQYLPGGASLQRLRAAVLNYLGLEYAWDVKFVVRCMHVPATELGSFGQLGWNTWMSPHEGGIDAGDVIIDMSQMPEGADKSVRKF